MDTQQILRPPLKDSDAAAAILKHYERAQALVTKTVRTAALACESALSCGEILLQVKEEKKGEFHRWCAHYVPAISLRTIQNYMRIARGRRDLGDKAVDLHTIKQFYFALGVIPPGLYAQRQKSNAILSFWAFCEKIRNWAPNLPQEQLPRVKIWWESFGRDRGWL
jgi:hypothetical protein